MPSMMTRADFDAMVEARGPEFANAYLDKYGTEIVDDDELPADEDNMDLYGYDTPPPAPPPLAVRGEGALGGVQADGRDTGMRGWLEQSSQTIADIYDQAANELQRRYRGPTQGEMLMAMGAALLKPVQGGWKEALANMAGVIPQYMQQRREYSDEASGLMSRLQIAKANALAGLRGKYLTAAMKAPPRRRTGFNPITGELVDMDTGRPIEQDVPVLSPQQVAELSKDPANRGMKFKTTDGRVMEIR